MTSNVDITIPPQGLATTAGVRGNFATIKEEIDELHAAWGFAYYHNALAAQAVAADTLTILNNNILGVNTKIDALPVGAVKLWDAPSNRLYFNNLNVNSTVDLRVDLEITVTEADQDFALSLNLGIGSGSANTLQLPMSANLKVDDTYYVVSSLGFPINSNDIKNNPASINIKSDAACNVKVIGWYIKAMRRVGA